MTFPCQTVILLLLTACRGRLGTNEVVVRMHQAGRAVDQAALYGLLRQVRDLALPLLSVMQVEPKQADVPDVQP